MFPVLRFLKVTFRCNKLGWTHVLIYIFTPTICTSHKMGQTKRTEMSVNFKHLKLQNNL
jgi:hypothetical protein